MSLIAGDVFWIFDPKKLEPLSRARSIDADVQILCRVSLSHLPRRLMRGTGSLVTQPNEIILVSTRSQAICSSAKQSQVRNPDCEYMKGFENTSLKGFAILMNHITMRAGKRIEKQNRVIQCRIVTQGTQHVEKIAQRWRWEQHPQRTQICSSLVPVE